MTNYILTVLYYLLHFYQGQKCHHIQVVMVGEHEKNNAMLFSHVFSLCNEFF